MTQIQHTQHGQFRVYPDDVYLYIPDKNYTGTDQSKLLVEIDGYQVELEYLFKVVGPESLAGAVHRYDPYEDPEYYPKGLF